MPATSNRPDRMALPPRRSYRRTAVLRKLVVAACRSPCRSDAYRGGYTTVQSPCRRPADGVACPTAVGSQRLRACRCAVGPRLVVTRLCSDYHHSGKSAEAARPGSALRMWWCAFATGCHGGGGVASLSLRLPASCWRLVGRARLGYHCSGHHAIRFAHPSAGTRGPWDYRRRRRSAEQVRPCGRPSCRGLVAASWFPCCGQSAARSCCCNRAAGAGRRWDFRAHDLPLSKLLTVSPLSGSTTHRSPTLVRAQCNMTRGC